MDHVRLSSIEAEDLKHRERMEAIHLENEAEIRRLEEKREATSGRIACLLQGGYF